MGFNKRECRKLACPEARFNLGSGVLHLAKIQHIVRAAVKNIAQRRVLIVYFYNREAVLGGRFEPEYTLFQCKDDYITLYFADGGTGKWREASLDNLGDRYAYFIRTCAFYRLSDERLVTRFCGVSDKTGFDALNGLQEAIMCARLKKRVLARERKIEKRMKPVPAVPRKLKGWIRRKVLPHYVFYEYRRGGKPLNGYCTACKRDMLVSGAKHNGKGVCPNCGKNVTFKSSGKAKRVCDRDTVQIIQRTGENELLIRWYKASNNLYNWKNPKLSLFESARAFTYLDKRGEMTVESYYNDLSKGTYTHWQKGIRPRFSYYQYNFDCDVCGHLFCGNLAEALKGTVWQYSQLEQYYNSDRTPLEVIPYLHAYNKYPAIEYIIKLGLLNIAHAIIYENNGERIINKGGRNLSEALGVWPEDLPLLQKISANVRQLELCQKLKQYGIKTDESLLLWYKEQKIASAEDAVIPLKYTTQIKLMRYISKQFERQKDRKTERGGVRYIDQKGVLSNYKDYLDMGGKLKYDFKNEFVLFPKDLPRAHDQTSTVYNHKKGEIFNEFIRNAYESLLNKYNFTKGELTLVPPKTADEIIKEGHILHHCVGSYLEKVADGRSVILFIRQTDKIKEPFYTVELQNDRVIQIHGKYHCAPTPEVQSFLELWKQRKLRKAG